MVSLREPSMKGTIRTPEGRKGMKSKLSELICPT